MSSIKFVDLGLRESLVAELNKLGYENPSSIQEQAIPIIMNGKDVVGLSETGSGKTAAFGLPILNKVDTSDPCAQALVICPTRELCLQVSKEIQKLGAQVKGLHVAAVYGGASMSVQLKDLKKAQIVVGTPGRLMDHMRRSSLKVSKIGTVILDEADRMLDMGFKEDMEEILSKMPSDKQTLYFSATMNKQVERLIGNFSKNPEVVQVARKNQTVKNIEQVVYELRPGSKTEAVARLLDMNEHRLAIIFCNTKRLVDEVVENLNANGFSAEGLHGDMAQLMRDRVTQRFRDSKITILVATDVAARGLDINDLDLVFNYDMPADPEDYVHRIGRTGRAGRSGKAISFIFGRDVQRLRNIERFTSLSIKREPVPKREEVSLRRMEILLSQIKEGDSAESMEALGGVFGEEADYKELAGKLFNLLQKKVSREVVKIVEDDPKSQQPRRERDDRSRSRDKRGEKRERGERGERGERSKRPSRDRDGGNTKGMEQVFLNVGKSQGATAGEIVGMIYNKCEVPRGSVGRIQVLYKHSLVQLKKEHVKIATKVLTKAKLRGVELVCRADRES